MNKVDLSKRLLDADVNQIAVNARKSILVLTQSATRLNTEIDNSVPALNNLR